MRDPFTHREISADTFDDRAIAYTAEREEIADRLDYAVARWDDALGARSQLYWEREVNDLREELSRYDAALDNMQHQAEDVADMAGWLEEGGDTGDFDTDYDIDTGEDSDALGYYLGDVPEWWLDEFGDEPADEFELGLDYGDEE